MTTLVGRRFSQSRVAPADVIYEQISNYVKQPRQHKTQHLSRGKDPSTRCALSIAAIYALAHGTAGWRVAVANGTASAASLALLYGTRADTASLHSTVERHELPGRESEDIGGDFALRRVISDTVSEYTPLGSMPSPRLCAR